LGISTNVDMIAGLPNQDEDSFVSDVSALGAIGPDQITTYPLLVIRGVKVTPSMSSKVMHEVIERSGKILSDFGYKRDSVWIFSKDDDVYDSSGDELVNDYLGFGPAAFSRIGNTQVVNPPVNLYLNMINNDSHFGFRTDLDDNAEVWRTFAHELYKLKLDPKTVEKLPRAIRIVLLMLKLSGNIRKSTVTTKGRYFVHEITKAVVESLPFPITNHKAVENWQDYVATNKEQQRISQKNEIAKLSSIEIEYPRTRSDILSEDLKEKIPIT